MFDLKNKKISIIGGKRSGLALAKLVKNLGGFPRISDKSSSDAFSKNDLDWLKAQNISLEFNQHTPEFILDADLVVLSPGVPINAAPVLWAKEKKIPVLGEIEFAAQFCRKPIIAVTGSNGKTTTVTLITEILKKAGKKVCLCGNVGDAFSNYAQDINQYDFVVLEVSSFQLEVLRKAGAFKPHVAVILNFSQNHLDRHKDLDEYFEAKARIFINQDKNDFAVLDHQNERLRNLAGRLESKVLFYNSPEALEGKEGINPNFLAAMTVAKILGVSEKICQDVFSGFKGVEHRLEWVRTIRGVDFVNDSKATTAEAGRWALERIQKPIVMICGGRDKNIDFSVLTGLVQKKVKSMVVYGEAREKLQKIFMPVVGVKVCPKLDEAVVEAQKIAQEGDCVVLSPMCASFDLFSSYEERGKVFKQLVHQLK